jgi:hypothetical protein
MSKSSPQSVADSIFASAGFPPRRSVSTQQDATDTAPTAKTGTGIRSPIIDGLSTAEQNR